MCTAPCFFVAQQTKSGPDQSGQQWLLTSARPAERKGDGEPEQDEHRSRREDGPETTQDNATGRGLGFADDERRQAQQRHQPQLTLSADKSATTSGKGSIPLRARAAVAGGGGGGGGEKSAVTSATGNAARGDGAVLVMQRSERCAIGGNYPEYDTWRFHHRAGRYHCTG